MPIEISTAIEAYDQETFHAVDRRIMGVVFDVHNEFGRLMDEELYKLEIAERCLALGIVPVEREVRIQVRHATFSKDYFMDLLFCRGVMLEAKVAESLVAAHRSQALNYLLLAGLKHGRLVNLRTERVQHEFVSTTLTAEERRRFEVVEHEWVEREEQSRLLKVKMIDLLTDWGAFLDVGLYREALIHFMGGPGVVCQPIQVFSGLRTLGVQNLNLINGETVVALTTKQTDAGAFRDNLSRLLHHTKLKAIQWINLNRHVVEFTTLMK
jgi:GxxExxY protein